MITPPWKLDDFAWEHIARLPDDEKEYGLATFQHYYYNSYKVPCVATFLIWACFLTLGLASGLSAFIQHFFPHQHHVITRRAGWWRVNVSEHPLVSEKHSQAVACGKGSFAWLTVHLPLRLEAALLVVMLALNVVPLCTFYSLYVGHNTYFVGTDSVSRRSQVLRHVANRCATLGIGQLPMLILLASKRTPVALLSQLSMSAMMLFHRWIARMCYLHIIIHILCNALIFHFSIGFAESLKQPPVQVGTVATVMLFGLVFLSLRTLRKNHYEVFVFLHISMALTMLVCIYLHIKLLHQGRLGLQMFVIELTAGFWAFDRAIRLVGRVVMSISWRYADGAGTTRKAELTSYGDGAYIRVRIQVPLSRLRLPPSATTSLTGSWIDLEDESKGRGGRRVNSPSNASLLDFARIGAGDDIRISVPRLQWVGDHPFSVFAVGRCKNGRRGMGFVDLIVQRQSGLTQKLSDLAEELGTPAAHFDGSARDAYAQSATHQKGKRVRVVVDGPFGRSPSLEGAQHAVLVAGGIAITFCYPLLVKAARGDFGSLETCKLVWIVRNEAILDVLRDSLPELLEEISLQGNRRCQLSIDIYVTYKAKPSSNESSTTLVGSAKQKLPSKLAPTWHLPIFLPRSQSSSSTDTFVCVERSPSTRSVGQSPSEVKLWPGIKYKQEKELDLVPVLTRSRSPSRPSPIQHSKAVAAGTGIDVTFSFDNRYSPVESSEGGSAAHRDSTHWSCSFSPSRRSSTRSADSGDTPSQTDLSTLVAPEPSFSWRAGLAGSDRSKESLDQALVCKLTRSEFLDASPAPHSCEVTSDTSDQFAEDRRRGGLSCPRSGQLSAHPLWTPQSATHHRFHSPQDVLAETDAAALIEIRRFSGRPRSMALVHQHITDHADGQFAGRTVFATCGPAAMCDSVRAEVVSLLKQGRDVSLVEDCFNW
ncbi:FAD-binding 8 [Kalmanozyma brasiliensis GHG001]|uniref:FAD-binding FR-type domain-containing protein n=1 Tax=Kalmanozyma brasiliensis (strain GHG001) TaxID=1365824 RepID=V5EHZ6_KALBG|nr:FAD-binding 8 [Kalmanozyma brasiliensis GHG001]EST10226.1 FAD-binding 8 [Kalmanozyma brasiliensis GHG001]